MLSGDIYDLWFAPLRASELDGNDLVLDVANDFCEVWLAENYLSLLQDVLAHVAGRKLQIKFRVVTGQTPATPANHNSHASVAKPKTTEAGPDRAPAAAELNFNPKNTFDSFVVGNNNNFAHAAAHAVAQAPGKAYNPLFLYGGVGLGKPICCTPSASTSSATKRARGSPTSRRKNSPTNTSSPSRTTSSSSSAKNTARPTCC